MLQLELVQSTLIFSAVFYVTISFFFNQNKQVQNDLKFKKSNFLRCLVVLVVIAAAKLVNSTLLSILLILSESPSCIVI